MIIKCRFLKNSVPYGKEYTYRSAENVAVGDYVQVNPMATGIVTAVNVPEDEIAAFVDKIKTITGKIEDDKEND